VRKLKQDARTSPHVPRRPLNCCRSVSKRKLSGGEIARKRIGRELIMFAKYVRVRRIATGLRASLRDLAARPHEHDIDAPLAFNIKCQPSIAFAYSSQPDRTSRAHDARPGFWRGPVDQKSGAHDGPCNCAAHRTPDGILYSGLGKTRRTRNVSLAASMMGSIASTLAVTVASTGGSK
jgi:hypothetical protein